MLSPTLRRIFKDYHHIEIGLYSYGSCFNPHAIASRTQIGRYCSFADGVRVFNGNHPVEFKSTHPYFYNPAFGYVEKEMIPRNTLKIGNDVWLGYNSVILPGVETIGDGAVIGAGAIVTKNVPDFGVVVGNPARVVRYRFPEEIRKQISNSQWWNKNIEQIRQEMPEFTHPIE
jgi:acetyltransferase-like isoleucine patch superfamily enzyme